MEIHHWLILIIGVVFSVAIYSSVSQCLAGIRFRKRLKARDPLSDAEFVAEYYSDSGIPSDIPIRLRPIYGNFFEIDQLKIHPDELPPDIFEFDTIQLVDAIEREFDIKLDDNTQEQTTGEFDSIVRCIYRLTETNHS